MHITGFMTSDAQAIACTALFSSSYKHWCIIGIVFLLEPEHSIIPDTLKGTILPQLRLRQSCKLTGWKIKAGNNFSYHWKTMSCSMRIYDEVHLRTRAKMRHSPLRGILCLLLAVSLWQIKNKVPFKKCCCPVPCASTCVRKGTLSKWESAMLSPQPSGWALILEDF